MFELLQLEFMQRAFAAGIVIAIVAPLIGNYLVVRGYSLMFDTLAHVALAGIAIGLLAGTQPLPIALGVTVVAAAGIEWLRSRQQAYSESILALFLSGSLAIAIVIMSASNNLNGDLLSYLFGSITTVSSTDLWLITVLGAVVLAFVAIFYRQLFLLSFDEEVAHTSGLRVRALNMLVVVLAAVIVVLSMRIVGALLIGALMVIPVVTAIQWGRGFAHTMLLSVTAALISVIVGLTASYYLDLASGGTIVVVSLIVFGISVLARGRFTGV